MVKNARLCCLGVVFGPEGILLERKNKDERWNLPLVEHIDGESPESSLEKGLFQRFGVKARTIGIFPKIISSYKDENNEQMIILSYYCSYFNGTKKESDGYQSDWIKTRELRNIGLEGYSKEVISEIEMMSSSCMDYIIQKDREIFLRK